MDKIFSYENVGRHTAMAPAKKEAVDWAVAAGAARDSTEVMSLDEIPLAYLPGGAVRIKAKAVGDLVRLGDSR